MAEDFVFPGNSAGARLGPNENPAGRDALDSFKQEDAGGPASGRFEKILKAFILVGAIFLGGELVWLLGVSPFRPFSRIDISGYDGISRDEVLVCAGITRDLSFFSADARAMEAALQGLSSLESARVIKRFPDRLQIALEGRRPVASALAGSGGRTVPALFDSQGVIFRVGGEAMEESFPHPLPVISGLAIEDPFPGMRLPVMFIPLFKELEKIEMSAPELLSAVSELRIDPKSFDGFDLILYPVHKKIKVRLSELNEDMLRYTLLMVDVLASKEPGIESLDFRSGIASYIPKEASSEQ